MGYFSFPLLFVWPLCNGVTDHSAVKAVLETASPSGHHARWWTRVFSRGVKEVTIVYHPGKDNVLADALLCNPTGSAPVNGLAEEKTQVAAVKSAPTTIDSVLKMTPAVGCSKYDLMDEQSKDPDMLDYLRTNVLSEDQKEARCIVAQAPSFCMLNGVLHFIDSRLGNTKRVVAPQSLRSLIMTENHSGPCAGHFAGNKLYNMLVIHWY